jgi:hypothetical protein
MTGSDEAIVSDLDHPVCISPILPLQEPQSYSNSNATKPRTQLYVEFVITIAVEGNKFNITLRPVEYEGEEPPACIVLASDMNVTFGLRDTIGVGITDYNEVFWIKNGIYQGMNLVL